MATVTVAELIVDMLDLADMTDTKFISPTQQIRYVSAAYAKLYRQIVTLYEDHFMVDPPPQTTVTSAAPYIALPADFFKLVGIDRQYGSDWVPLNSFNFRERDSKSIVATLRGYAPSVRYRLVADKILFDNEDYAPGVYRLWYTPKPDQFVLDTETVDLSQDVHRELVAHYGARRCLLKEDQELGTIDREIAILELELDTSDSQRDSGAPQVITDMTGNDGYWGNSVDW